MTSPYQPPEHREVPGSPPFTPARALSWMLGAFLLMIAFAVVYFAIDPQAQSDLVGLGIVSAVAFLLMSSWLIGRYPGGTRLSEPLGVRPSHPGAIVLGFLIGLSAKVPAEQISIWIHRLAPRTDEQEAAFSAMFQPESPVHAAAILLVIAGLVPVAEEVFFRGAVYGALRRSRASEAQAALVTALGFAFCHADIRQLLPIFLVALLLASLRTFSGSLLPGIAAHMAFNGVAILGATYELLPEVNEIPMQLRVGATAALLGFVYLLVTVVGRHPRAQDARKREMLTVEDETPRRGEYE